MGMEGLANVLGAYGQYAGAQFTPEQQASILSSLGMQNVLGNNALASQQMNPNQYGGLPPVDLSSSNTGGNSAAGLGMGGINDNMYGQQALYGGRGVNSMGMQSGRSNGQRQDNDMTGNLPNGLGAMYGHYGGNGNSAGFGGQYGAMPRQQRMGSGGANEVSNQWKLFVGQLPPEVSSTFSQTSLLPILALGCKACAGTVWKSSKAAPLPCALLLVLVEPTPVCMSVLPFLLLSAIANHP